MYCFVLLYHNHKKKNLVLLVVNKSGHTCLSNKLHAGSEGYIHLTNYNLITKIIITIEKTMQVCKVWNVAWLMFFEWVEKWTSISLTSTVSCAVLSFTSWSHLCWLLLLLGGWKICLWWFLLKVLVVIIITV